MRKIIASVLLMALSTANATYMDGNRLHQLGQAIARNANGNATDEDSRNGFAFYAYVEGVLDTVNDAALCVPNTVTVGQLGAIVNKFLNDNPERWHYNASSIVVVALQSTFGCSKKK